MKPKNPEVEKIINYLQGKIDNLKKKLSSFESPMMQDMAKNSPHLQMDYIRMSSELQANEDNLLAIKTFTEKAGVIIQKKKGDKADDKKADEK